MAGKSAGTAADVKATAGTKMFDPADVGTWTAGTVQVTSYAKLTAGGEQLIHSAKCTFSFSGTSPAPAKAAVTGTSEVTLTATAKRLQKGPSNVLVDANEEKDSYGNALTVSASGKIKTS
jgi:hypothetical protein